LEGLVLRCENAACLKDKKQMVKLRKQKISIILITISIILALATFSFIPFTGGDNFAYFSLSRAIALGKGYVELWTPDLSLHTQYPPVFPILLLPAAFFNSYLSAKLIVFLCYILSLLFSYRLYSELNGKKSETATLVAFLLFAFTPVILEYSSWVLSEIPYILVSVLSLYFWSRKRYNISLLFAGFTFFIRTAGVTLLITVSIFYFLKFKREKKKIIIPLFSLLSVLLWLIYIRLFKDPAQISYLQQLLFKNPYNPALGNIGILGLITRIGRNIWLMPFKVFPQMFWGKSDITSLSFFIGIILIGFLLLGILGDKIFNKKKKRKRQRNSIFSTVNLMNLYLFLYLLTVWSWPSIWSADKRFYLPILPIICFWIGKGMLNVLKWFPKSSRKKLFYFIIPGILAAHCIFVSLVGTPKLWKNNINWIKHGIPSREALYFKSYIDIKKWARLQKIPEESVFIARKKGAFYHFTRFTAVSVPKTENRYELKSIIEKNKVDYIIVSAFFHSKFVLLRGMEALKDEYDFVPVYIEPDRTVAVFKCERKQAVNEK
jgi:hypothetical protein